MLQADPPPKAVKVTMSKRVPLVGDELLAYEEEQNRIKKEEAMKASIIKEEESKAVRASENVGDPMVIDASNTQASQEGIFSQEVDIVAIFVVVYVLNVICSEKMFSLAGKGGSNES